jgi:hypothetical protein
MRRVQQLTAACAGLFLAAAAFAHHSFAMFDMSKQITVVGTVREVEWVSPHMWLWLDVTGAGQAAPQVYGFEALSAGELHRREGWSKSTVKPGDKITVQYAPFRNGKAGGRLVHVLLADGRTLGAGAGDAAPARNPPP